MVQLNVQDLRETLIRQEETIIFSLIERAQFAHNPIIYKPGAFELPGFSGSFSDYLLWETEKIHAKVRRYTSPDEHPFFDDLPDIILPPMTFPEQIKPNAININPQIRQLYYTQILPRVCAPGDDENYGSSATCDVTCLQAISKRVHYGKFVAEAKYARAPHTYRPLIDAGNATEILATLTVPEVEQKLLARVRLKAKTYGQDIDSTRDAPTYKVNPDVIVYIYDKWLIPLTKQVQVQYLLKR